jgi:hypothetical protein
MALNQESLVNNIMNGVDVNPNRIYAGRMIEITKKLEVDRDDYKRKGTVDD